MSKKIFYEGYVLTTAYWILNSYFMDWPADYLLGCGAFSIFGSDNIFLIGMYAYISDITTNENRTKRIGVIDIVAFGAIVAGLLASGYVFDESGYLGVFWGVLVLQVFGLVYIILFVKESCGPNKVTCSPVSEDRRNSNITRQSSVARYISIFDCGQVADVFKVTFKRRDYKLRRIILTLLVILICNNVASNLQSYLTISHSN